MGEARLGDGFETLDIGVHLEVTLLFGIVIALFPAVIQGDCDPRSLLQGFERFACGHLGPRCAAR
jgi:hypothetical protein